MSDFSADRLKVLGFLLEDDAGSRMELALLLAIAAALGGLALLAWHKLNMNHS